MGALSTSKLGFFQDLVEGWSVEHFGMHFLELPLLDQQIVISAMVSTYPLIEEDSKLMADLQEWLSDISPPH